MAYRPHPILLGIAISLGPLVQATAQETDGEALLNDLLREGRPLYETNCAACHGADGRGGNGPRLDGNATLGFQGPLVNQILRGVPERGMPPFAGLLDDREIAAIATYVRNSWSNEFGVVVEERVARGRE